MAQQLQTYSISAPGFLGLNSQDSPLDLASGFALIANNCIIDQFGRIGAREGWTPLHISLDALGSNKIEAIGELLTDSGAKYIVAAGNGKLFKLVGTTLSELTYGGGGVAPTITANNWQIVALNECIYFFQAGHDPLIFDPAISTTQYRRISEKPGYVGTVNAGNIALSAYGRLWVASSTADKVTVWFSDILAGHVWDTGTAGFLRVDQVWQNGADNITGLAAHNGFLFIFGRNNILVYANAASPADLTLQDSITGIGCIARDTIQNTGDDVVFLSDTGVRSILRTIQEKSAPFRDLSKNVRTELMQNIAGEAPNTIKSVYSPFHSMYLLTLPVLKQVYCFDTKVALPDGSARVTKWDSIEPFSFCYTSDKKILIGKEGYIGSYSGYSDNGVAYRMSYFTNHTDFGAPSVSSILKKIKVIVIGGAAQFVTIKWGYDFGENYQSQNTFIPDQGLAYYNIDEYNECEYSAGVLQTVLTAYPTGSGVVAQTGYETDINGAALSIQRIEVQAKQGKII
jgi:hypothetical protein